MKSLIKMLNNTDSEFDRLLSRMNYLIESDCDGDCAFGATNISENENDYLIETHLPGAKKEDVKLKIKDNAIFITTERKEGHKDKKFIRKEYKFNKMERMFTLPNNIDIENIKANVENGLLTISLPKSEKDKSKEIQIL